MTKKIALPGVTEAIFAQDAVDLNVACWMVDSPQPVREEVVREPKHVEMAICRGPGIED